MISLEYALFQLLIAVNVTIPKPMLEAALILFLMILWVG